MKDDVTHWKGKGKTASPKVELKEELEQICSRIIMSIKSRNIPYDLLSSEGSAYGVHLIKQRIPTYEVSWIQRRDVIDAFELHGRDILEKMNENHWLAERGRKANAEVKRELWKHPSRDETDRSMGLLA